jgi:pimeloyl-ACP methyl ester carboxylesterase
MIDEQYINDNYFKRYSLPTNEHLLFLLTGQSISPRGFWDFKLPDGKTHSEYFVEAGIDVILFDPVGYGKSTAFYQYDRLDYAKQIKGVTDTITKKYKSATILGYSSSSPAALCSAQDGFFNKVILVGPNIVNNSDNNALPEIDVFETNIEMLRQKRLTEISERIIPKSNRLPNWEESLTEVIKTNTRYDNGNWSVPGQMVTDRINYWVKHKSNGFVVDKISLVKPILAIISEYEVETPVSEQGLLMSLFPDTQIACVPNSTHFSMWENDCDKTREFIIQYCTE